jgi:hypothetical protein
MKPEPENSTPSSRLLLRLCLALAMLLSLAASAAGTLKWDSRQDRVSADIESATLYQTLEQIALRAGWRVYLEPGITHDVSAKFENVTPGDALRRLLGDVNFALVPNTNSVPRLYVFRTVRQNATQLVEPADASKKLAKAKPIPNELIIRLKPGVKIDDIARLLGAKVIGKIDGLNAYRLSFEDQDKTDAAREQLASNSEVESVDSNYSIDRPNTAQPLASSSVPPPQLQLKPPPDTGRVIVGLIDTGLQPLGNDLDKFLLQAIAVAGQSQLDPSVPSHGTSMAETLLRSLQAISKGSTSVQILPVDVYGANATTSTFDVASGIVLAVNNGARVVNLSLGSDGDSTFLHEVIQAAAKQNITILAAAGNQPVATPFYPAAYSEVNAVTAIDNGQLAPYANRGSFVTLGAPGTSIVYYNNQPYYVTGTSAASAFASGMAAGYLETAGTSGNVQQFLRNNFGVKITSGAGK